MAAVLANACGTICDGACEVCGAVCRAPCKIFGSLCNGACQVCETCCHSFGELCSSPFSVYVTVAAVFNLPSIYMGLIGAGDWSCQGSQWLSINAILCIIHIVAAIYMAIVVMKEQPTNTAGTTGTGGERKPTTAFGRAGHLLCYDPWMALYILVLLGFFVWLWSGAIWTINGKIQNGCDGTNLTGKIATVMGFGWAFLFFGVGALSCGVCCAYCGVGNNPSSTLYHGEEPASTPYVNANKPTTTKPATASVDPEAPPSTTTTAPNSTYQKQQVPMAQAVLF